MMQYGPIFQRPILKTCQECLVQGDTSHYLKPPVDIKTKVLFWPGLAWPGQNGTFVLKSTVGFKQCDVSL